MITQVAQDNRTPDGTGHFFFAASELAAPFLLFTGNQREKFHVTTEEHYTMMRIMKFNLLTGLSKLRIDFVIGFPLLPG
ncbi:hypothetical protein SBV1_530025 [Verrucomicrobia bacterium]|nr:hypothetical protein SBV1_530025 [Verrucomicrobiota bacterium]